MIICLSCACGGVENLMRAVLREAKIKDWLTIPVHQGKGEARSILNTPGLQQFVECQVLLDYIEKTTSYAVVLGIKNGKCVWADAKRGDVKSRLDAQLVAEQFAD